MRILRGKSNLEVSSQGFAIFVAGLVLSTFLGGAVRTILSSERVQNRIVTELKARFPRNEFQIGQTEILLSRGLWPALGLRLRQVVFKQDVCGKLSFVLDMPELVMPVDLLALRHGQVRLKTVEATNGRMRLDFKSCAPPADGAVTTEARSTPSLRATVAERGIQPPALNWREAAKSVEAFRLKNFELTYERNLTWKLMIRDADVNLGETLRIDTRMDVQKSLPFGALTHVMDVHAVGENDHLKWTLSSDFKEGGIKWTGDWDLLKNQAELKAQLVQLPLKDLSSELFQMGLVARDFKLSTAWLTCQAHWEGDVSKYEAAPLQFRSCKIEGAYGRVEMEPSELYLSGQPRFRLPARVHAQKLQLQPLIEALGQAVLPAVLPRLGVWTGILDYTAIDAWSLEGALENAEILFSNQSVRGKQNVRRARTSFKRVQDQYAGTVAGVELQDGEWDGTVEFDFSEASRQGRVSVGVNRLSFAPAIQNVLIGGQMAPLRVTGRGTFSGTELISWSGQASTSELRGDGWRGEGVELSSKYAANVFHVEGKAARVAVDTRWRYYAQLTQVREAVPEWWAWRDLSLKADVHSNGGTLNTLSATEVNSHQIWRAKGSWIREGEFLGSLSLGATKPQVFALTGEKGGLLVQDKASGASRE